MKYSEIPKEDLIFVSDKMIGIVLMRAKHDSLGYKINPHNYYKVEKHKPTGKLIIFPTGDNAKKEFKDDIKNVILKKLSKLN